MSLSIDPTALSRSGPLDKIAKALEIAHTVYGIKGALQAQDIAKQHADQEKATYDQGQDPNSTGAAAARAEQSAILSAAANKGYLPQDSASSLLKLVNGTPAKAAVVPVGPSEESGALPKGGSPAVAGTPGMSIAQLGAAMPSDKGLNAYIKGEQTAATKDRGLEMMAAAMAGRNTRADTRLQGQANQQYSKQMGSIENTVQAANRAQQIVRELQSADPNDPNSLKSTKAMMTDLNGAMGSLFTGGKSPTVHAMTGASQDTAYGSLQSALTRITGQPFNTQTIPLLHQMDVDIGALKNSYSKAHNTAYKSFRAGLDDAVVPKLDDRFSQFRNDAGLDSSSSDSKGPPSVTQSGSGGLIRSANAGGDSVSVVSPEGKTGSIPRAKLQDALKRGFKVK